MPKNFYIIPLILLITSAFSQNVSHFKMKKNMRKASKYIQNGYLKAPRVVDAGNNGFIIRYSNKIISLDNNLKKKWEAPASDTRTSKNFLFTSNFYIVCNNAFVYDIITFNGFHGVVEVMVSAYNINTGEVNVMYVPFTCSEVCKIVDFYALSDGLHFKKLEYDSKMKFKSEFVGSIDGLGRVKESRMSFRTGL